MSVSYQEIGFLKDKVHAAERKRVRLCAHKDIGDKLHEMFIVLARGSYVRPSKHLKDESAHIVEGAVDYIFFDDRGDIAQVLPMGDYLSGGRFYCRVPESVYHTLIIRSDFLVFHETSHGPFRRSNTVFAPWAPEEGDIAAVGRFVKEIEGAAANFLIRSSEQA